MSTLERDDEYKDYGPNRFVILFWIIVVSGIFVGTTIITVFARAGFFDNV